jgi:hypothetical protein
VKTKMSESEAAVQIENPLLEKWRAHANRLKRLQGASHSFFKGRADMPLFTTVALSLGVGCLNLTYIMGQPSAPTGIPAIVSPPPFFTFERVRGGGEPGTRMTEQGGAAQ